MDQTAPESDPSRWPSSGDNWLSEGEALIAALRSIGEEDGPDRSGRPRNYAFFMLGFADTPLSEMRRKPLV